MPEETSQNASPDRLLDVVVIGGGQAGLAIAWHLKRQGLRFVVLEAGSELGHTWRDRWDSLKLFTPAQYDGLPGMPFPAPADTYPTQGSGGRLPPDLCDRLRPAGSAQRPGDQPYPERRRVRGPYRRRHLPGPTGRGGHRPLPGALHSAGRPRAGAVGDPDPQCQLPQPAGACRTDRCWSSAAATPGSRSPRNSLPPARSTCRSVSGHRCCPSGWLGRDLFWWLTRLGLLRVTVDSRLGRRASRRRVHHRHQQAAAPQGRRTVPAATGRG